MPLGTDSSAGQLVAARARPAKFHGTLRRARGFLIAPAGCALGVTLWAAVTPITVASREELFEIPQGTWARRMAGDRVEILPSQIHLTLEVRDVLLIRNLDDVPQVFGPALMMPGQSFRLPFEVASSYQFVCTAHASGQMAVIVESEPKTPWARLRWKARELLKRQPSQRQLQGEQAGAV